MKDIKLKERLEKVFEAFFSDEKISGNQSLSIPDYENSSIEKTSLFSDTSKKIFNIFKQIFVFLPANFLLFFMSVVFTALFLLRPVGRGGRGSFLVILVFLLAALLTVFGLGDLRKLKHYLIPLSTISIGIIAGTIGSILLGDQGFGYFLRNYIAYFFPLAFIAPVLMKSWLDSSDE